ncbi:hypothetical protein GLOTRDRAFT_134082 [Gloeophyllum trabeum ATCC 11539]|uniref:F-box domain-containing protein n=1 Tax=Gloeophyllum trabeum (strain ATCC 11539 / FP-39264 / Madison 617) TaxID=670483 RepID=S7RCY0_GLOTA|nr:uncharacterized protein GLOTRDRAFT_134082 [Gloeophyllum trabeum ATCC 11539]EPQ50274.1 hypothetical protein GLOTRDRAFT_134082 [Gloeophyllum trabeum ATCC 11539]
MVHSSYNMAPGDLELRGAVANRLRRPGDTIDIDGITYEYCDSSDDESIDEAHQVGPGKTFGIFISRISAPLEMFLGYAAETWLGRRPRAVFNRLFKDVMHRPCPMVGDRCLDPTSAEKLWIDIVNCKDPAQKERNIGSLALLRNYIMRRQMDRFKDPDTVRALHEVNARIVEAESTATLKREEVADIQQDLRLLQRTRERAEASRPTTQSYIESLPAAFFEGIDIALRALDERIRTRSEVMPPAEERMREAERALDELIESRRPLLAQTSPAQVVPEEIWINIWMWAENLHCPEPKPGLAYVFSWVCTRWRKIFLRTPTLWRQVRVSLGTSSDLLRLQLQRSDPCPLDVYFIFGNRRIKREDTPRKVNMLLTELVFCANRWVSFHLGGTTDLDFYDDSKLVGWSLYTDGIQDMLSKAHAPRLRHFCAWWYGDPTLIVGRGLCPPVACSLSELQICGFAIRTNLSLFSGLTSLELVRPSVRDLPSIWEFRDMLVQCPSLVHLGLDGKCFNSDSSFRLRFPDPLPLPALRSLMLRFIDYEQEEEVLFIHELFDTFAAPALSTLYVLHLDVPCLTAFVEALEAKPMVCASGTLPVLFLRFGGYKEEDHGIPSALATRTLVLFPQLRHLWLCSGVQDTRSFLRALRNIKECQREPGCSSLHAVTLELHVIREHNADDFISRARKIGVRDITVRLYHSFNDTWLDYDVWRQHDRSRGAIIERVTWCESAFECFEKRTIRAHLIHT